MSRAGRPLVALALLMTLLAAPLAAASGASPPEGAQSLTAGTRTAVYWISAADGGGNVTFELRPGAQAALTVATLMDRQDANATAIVWNVTVESADLLFIPANATLVKDYSGDMTTSEAYHFASFDFTAPDAEGNYTYTVRAESYARDADGNLTLLGTGEATGHVFVAAGTVIVPGTPFWRTTPFLVTVALLLLAAVVIGGFGYRQRRLRERMNAAPRRSQVMREMELERQLEKVEEKDPEQAAVIKQEIRAQEQVREKRRELQILEAKRADALKTIDLLKKRHEAGGLTKLQFDNMVAKKQADLQRIEAEIAQMEAEDAAGGSAAA